MLRFQAEAIVLVVHSSILTFQASVEEITWIKLNAGLVSKHFHADSGFRWTHPDSQFINTFGIKDKIMVVANGIPAGSK